MRQLRSRHDRDADDILATFTTRSGDHYCVPTLRSLDMHLAALADRIRHAARFPVLVARYRRDADELLDRREYLRLTTEVR